MNNQVNFTQENETDGVAVLALTGYFLVIQNDTENTFDSLLDSEV